MSARERWETTLRALRRAAASGGKSGRQIADEIGLHHATLLKILSGETSTPHPRTRQAIIAWVETELEQHPHAGDIAGSGTSDAGGAFAQPNHGGIAPHDPTDEDLVRTIIGEPNALRRVLGVVPAGSVKVRLAIIRQYEDVLIERNVPPSRWPQWFREIRDEILRSGEERGDE